MSERCVVGALLLTLLGFGCGSGCERKDEGAEATSAPSGGESAGVGTVEGVVRLVAGAELPSYPPVRAEGQPPIPDECTPPQISDSQPVALEGDRLLRGLLVQASGFSEQGMERVVRDPIIHEVFIRDCRLTPRFVPAVMGDTLKLTNETDYPFLPSLGGGGLTQAVLHQQSREFPLDRGGIFSMTCGFAAPCGRSDLVVVFHPVHAVTGEGGAFRMENVPADEDVRIHAWHPLFQEVSQMVRVGDGETVRIELEITPAPQPEPPPDTDTDGEEEPDGPVEDQPGLF